MAQEYKGTVVRVALGGISSASDIRMLNDLLGRVDAVRSHFVDVENNTLTAYLDDRLPGTEEALVKALFAAGMYPRGFKETGFDYEDGSNVC